MFDTDTQVGVHANTLSHTPHPHPIIAYSGMNRDNSIQRKGHFSILHSIIIKDSLYCIKDSFQGPNVSFIERFHYILPLN